MATTRIPDLRRALRAGLEAQPEPVLAPGDRLAAVLALIVERPEPAVVFTVRAGGLSRHPGEVSLPGGIVDPDETPAEAALREAREEIGLEPGPELLGTLPSVHTHVSGILVVPHVGVVDEPPALTPATAEIDRIVTVPLDELFAAESEVRWERPDGERWRGWVYEVADITVWGATGRMVHDLLAVLRRSAG
jgi:8-oxo-dGTP pyrophosphatase MutT (NUDIX family)